MGDCYDSIAEQFPELSKKRIRSIVDDVSEIERQVKESGVTLTGPEFRARVMDELNQRRIEFVGRKRAIVENIFKDQQNTSYLTQSQFTNDPVSAIQGKLVGGTTRLSQGGNLSVGGMAIAERARLVSMLNNGLKALDLDTVAEKGTLDRDVAQETWELRKGGNPGSTQNPIASRIAGVIKAVNNAMYESKKGAGAAINRLDDYITRGTHDPTKVRTAGFDAWRDAVGQTHDMVKSFGPMNPEMVENSLKEIYNDIISGKFGAGKSDLGEQVSRARTLVPKDGNSWHEYNQQFGKAGLYQTVVGDISRTGKQVAAMYHFGTNPEEGLANMLKSARIAYADNPDVLGKLAEKERSIKDMFQFVAGPSGAPGTSLMAKIPGWMRVGEALIRTGNASFSAMTDIVSAIHRVQPITGEGIFSSASKMAQDYLGTFAKGAERRLWGQRLGLALEETTQEALARLGAEGAEPGLMAKVMETFGHLNLITNHVESAKIASARQVAMALADHADSEFSSLTPDMRADLGRFGIEPKSWDVIRLGTEIDPRGFKIVTPEAINGLDVPDAQKFDARVKIAALYNEIGDTGSVTPGPKQRYQLIGNTDPNTAWGQFRRMTAQFKTIPLKLGNTAMTVLMSNPEKMPTSITDALLHRQGNMRGFMSFLGTALGMGYLRNTLYDAAAGKTPRDPTDPGVIRDAFIQSGVAGLYGDFLVRELKSHYGISTLEGLAGPSITDGAKLLDLVRRFENGDAHGNDFVKYAGSLAPNWLVSKYAFDTLFGHHLMNTINPGYYQRVEQGVRHNRGLFSAHQEYFVTPPSQRKGLFE